MAKVKVVVTGRSPSGGTTPLVLDCEAASVAEALAGACVEFGIPLLRRDGSAPIPGTGVFIDGKDVRLAGGTATELQDGGVIAVICACPDT